MNIRFFKYFLLVLLTAGLMSCDIFEVEEVKDPNNPSQDELLIGANRAQLQNLVSGLEFRNRSYVGAGASGGAVTFLGAFGREVLPLFASDPRFISQWMGTSASADAETNPSFFQYGVVYNTSFNAVKQANFLIEAVNNADDRQNPLTQEDNNGYFGFAKTLKASGYVLAWLTQSEENGIRIDVDEPLNPGPFLPFQEAGQAILDLLDEGMSDLEGAGDSFPFEMQNGFQDFSTPERFILLNRALKARVALHLGDFDLVLEALQEAQPFFELAAGEEVMNKGAYHNFGAPPDVFNPFFFPQNARTSQIPMIHPDMIADAEAGDLRVVNKFFERNSPVTFSGFSSIYQDNRFASNTEAFTFIRNEELILMYAEALAQRNQAGDLQEAVDAINLVRNTWGLGDFASTDQQEVIDQVLFERRYSLWFEYGHRWLDLKRYDRLDEVLAIDEEFFPNQSTKVYEFVARPLSESQWDDFAGN